MPLEKPCDLALAKSAERAAQNLCLGRQIRFKFSVRVSHRFAFFHMSEEADQGVANVLTEAAFKAINDKS